LISHGINVCKYKLDRRKRKTPHKDGRYQEESLAFRITVWRNDKWKGVATGMATGIICPLLFLILRIQVVPG
jgi:hypothetical protein